MLNKYRNFKTFVVNNYDYNNNNFFRFDNQQRNAFLSFVTNISKNRVYSFSQYQQLNIEYSQQN